MDTPIYLLVKGCPRGDETRLSTCKSCPHHLGTVGEWPNVKVKCALKPDKELEVEKLVNCPLKNRAISFKKCLKCPVHQGFYGFHNGNPVVHCGMYTTENKSIIKLSLLV